MACVRLSTSVLVARTRATYHHGDLRNALVDAGAELAARGGPDAVTVRAAAKAVGVTPTAAYRHFAGHEELLEEVRQRAFATMAQAMRQHLESLPTSDDPVVDALRPLGAGGLGYVQFAITEPGFFRTAFHRKTAIDPETAERPDSPYAMLGAALDRLVDVGYLLPESRPMAELAAWSAVHGVATLIIDGPLGSLPDAELGEVVDRVLVTVALGIGDGPAADRVRPVIRSREWRQPGSLRTRQNGVGSG